MLRRFLPLPGFFLLTLSPASAVVLAGGTGNTSPPADDPGFANVGAINGASAVYLGNQWVITAAHVNPSTGGSVIFNSVTYTVASPVIQLTNNEAAGMSEQTDLALFQINVDPGLPALRISAGPASVTSAVTMIGNGRDRQSQAFWRVTQQPGFNNDIWTEVQPVDPYDATGFEIAAAGNGVTRWGTNSVAAANQNVTTAWGDLRAFATIFNTGSNEAQGVVGDSGGGVFQKNAGGDWELTGVMNAVGSFGNPLFYDNLPPNTAVLNQSATIIADLSFYRDQILSITSAPVPEPSGVALAGGGLLLMLAGRRREA